MEYLDAVNYQLDLMGSLPIGDLETDPPHPDVAMAEASLKTASRAVQKKQMWFNTDYGIEIIPDETTKEILLPTDTRKLIATSRLGVIQRGTKAYDTLNNTYQFDKPLFVTLVRTVSWDLLDDTVHDVILYRAAVHICQNELEDSLKADEQKEFLTDATIEMKRTNLKAQRRNIFTTPRVNRTRYRVRPYNLSAGMRNPIFPGG